MSSRVLQLLWLLSLCAPLSLALKSSVYDRELTLTLVEFASAVYDDDQEGLQTWTCRRCTGRTTGFTVVDLVIDEGYALRAFVGVTAGNLSAVVAFRGTRDTSFVNWLSDLAFLELDLHYPGAEQALVHSGFFSAYHSSSLRPRVTAAVKLIQDLFPGLPVHVTGHSLGAAIACLCALDLRVNLGVKNLYIATFGQPRVGNRKFSTYYHAQVPTSVRVTHGRDVVPHLPPLTEEPGNLGYYHVPTEVWSYSVGSEKMYQMEMVCDESGEDPNCSRSVRGTSISDHLTYFGVPLHHLARHHPPPEGPRASGAVEVSRATV